MYAISLFLLSEKKGSTSLNSCCYFLLCRGYMWNKTLKKFQNYFKIIF